MLRIIMNVGEQYCDWYCHECMRVQETCAVLGIESVPRREEGSTGKYQHEVEGVPEGAARGNCRDRMLVFSCNP